MVSCRCYLFGISINIGFNPPETMTAAKLSKVCYFVKDIAFNLEGAVQIEILYIIWLCSILKF